MNLLLWVILGAGLGIVGHFVDASRAKGGLIGSILFGIAGALSGGVTALYLFGTGFSTLDVWTLILALSGGLLVLLLHRTVLSQEHKF